jgi:hypothetical protein
MNLATRRVRLRSRKPFKRPPRWDVRSTHCSRLGELSKTVRLGNSEQRFVSRLAEYVRRIPFDELFGRGSAGNFSTRCERDRLNFTDGCRWRGTTRPVRVRPLIARPHSVAIVLFPVLKDRCFGCCWSSPLCGVPQIPVTAYIFRALPETCHLHSCCSELCNDSRETAAIRS